MIVVASRPGRLGNLLIVYANLLAWALEHNKKVVNPSFSIYSGYFKKTSSAGETVNRITYLLSYFFARVTDRLHLSNPLFGVRHLDWDEITDLDGGPTALPRTPFYFVQGWQYRANNLVKKHAGKLRQFFTPLPEYVKRLDDHWSKWVEPGKLVIGIHVRRGDYRTFEHGAFYFETEAYLAVMRKILSALGTEHVSFLLCSDDPTSIDNFKDSGMTILPAPHHELLDMYALARCNYIAGPPSTYSMWASFYGQVPLYMIRDPKRAISLSDFEIQTSF